VLCGGKVSGIVSGATKEEIGLLMTKVGGSRAEEGGSAE